MGGLEEIGPGTFGSRRRLSQALAVVLITLFVRSCQIMSYLASASKPHLDFEALKRTGQLCDLG